MFRGFFDKADLAEKYQSASADLGVVTLVLAGVADPFDPDPLWDSKYGGRSEIHEKMTGDDDFRLQDALNGCRDVRYERDSGGRFREKSPVFTDVVMWIAERSWNGDAMHGGYRLEALAGNLANLHRRKFSGSLPEDRKPIYTVMPDPGLAEEEAVFQFGFGVFVPGDNDVQQAALAFKTAPGDEGREIPAWSFWHRGAQTKRPVGVYRHQRTLLITADESGPVRAPLWVSHGEGHIAVNLNAADSDRVYTDDDILSVRANEETAVNDRPLTWTLSDARAADPHDAESFILELRPLVKPEAVPLSQGEEPSTKAAKRRRGQDAADAGEGAAARKAGRGFSWGRLFGDAGEAEADAEGEAPEDAEPPLSTRYALWLVGCALPRIHGHRAVNGLLRYTVWFDRDGLPIDFRGAGQHDKASGLALQARNDSSALYYRLPGEHGFQPVKTIPCVLRTESGRHVELLPPSIPDLHYGIVMIDPPMSYPLSPMPLIVGRSNIEPTAPQPDLPLEMLTHPDSLEWRPGGGFRGAKLNTLNLSRRHVEVRLDGDRLKLGMSEGKATVHILDADGAPRDSLGPKDAKARTLDAGEQFIVGGYLMRFGEVDRRSMMSPEATLVRMQTLRVQI